MYVAQQFFAQILMVNQWQCCVLAFLCAFAIGCALMADPDLLDVSFLRDDDLQCKDHAHHTDKNVMNTAEWYHSWNQRVLKYMPCKDLGNLRYSVEVETAPHPTKRSPKTSSCVKVLCHVHCCFIFFLFLFFFGQFKINKKIQFKIKTKQKKITVHKGHIAWRS